MTTHRWKIAVALTVALAALGGSVAWSVSAGGIMRTHHGRTAWMMGYVPTGATSPVRTLDDATHNAQAFTDRLGGLKVDEVLQFERNFYVKLVDTRGNGATEVLVDPSSGAVSIEYGPAMMWNTKYGFHTGRGASGMMGSMHGYGGMMNGTSGSGSYGPGMMNGTSGSGSDGPGMMNGTSGSGSYGPGMMNGTSGSGSYGPGMMGTRSRTRTGSVTIERARTLAQRWLDANEKGVTVETGGDRFPGYYTFEIMRTDRIDGMISVNASTGAVWPHWWHGAFVASA